MVLAVEAPSGHSDMLWDLEYVPGSVWNFREVKPITFDDQLWSGHHDPTQLHSNSFYSHYLFIGHFFKESLFREWKQVSRIHHTKDWLSVV